MQYPSLGTLGDEQPSAILGLDPTEPNPGRAALDASRRLLVR